MSKSACVPSRRILTLLVFVTGFALPFAAAAEPRVSQSYGKLPLHFEANQGQTHQDVRFLARGAGYSLYLTAGEAVLVLTKPNPDAKRDLRSTPERRGTQPRGTPVVVRMSLVGAAPKPLVSGLDELPGKANYLFAIRPRVPGSQPRPGSIPARSTAQRPETRRKPRAFRGTDAKEFPILSRWRPTMPPTC